MTGSWQSLNVTWLAPDSHMMSHDHLKPTGSSSWGAERDGKTQSSSHERVWRQWGIRSCATFSKKICNTHSQNHLIRCTFSTNQTSCNVVSFLALSSPSLSLTFSSPTSFCPFSIISFSYLPLPPPSSLLFFPSLFRTCKWRSTTPETLRRLTCTSEGRRWQRWWALSLLSSRRTNTESLACSSNVDSTTISLTPLTSLVSHVMQCHVISCDIMWCHMQCHVMSCDIMWYHVMSWCAISCDVMISIWKLQNPFYIYISSKNDVIYMWIWKYCVLMCDYSSISKYRLLFCSCRLYWTVNKLSNTGKSSTSCIAQFTLD